MVSVVFRPTVGQVADGYNGFRARFTSVAEAVQHVRGFGYEVTELEMCGTYSEFPWARHFRVGGNGALYILR
jgi:hypothetical protein